MAARGQTRSPPAQTPPQPASPCLAYPLLQADSWQQQQQQQFQQLQQQGATVGLGGFQLQVRACTCRTECMAGSVCSWFCRRGFCLNPRLGAPLHGAQAACSLQVNTGAGGSGGEDDASSRASSPTKSPLGVGSTPFLDAHDQPLARQPPGARAASRASQQSLGSGRRHSQFDGAAADVVAAEQQRMRPDSPLGRRPGLPNWQELAGQEGLAGGGGGAPPSAGLSGGRGGTPPARMFGGAPNGGGLFGAAPGGNPSGGGVPRGLFGNSAAPSDPVTYQMQAALDKDGVPNLGEVQDEQPGAPALQSPMAQQQPQWHIPAVHTHGGTPGSGGRARRGGGGPGTPGVSQGVGKRGLLDKPKPGAAFKLGKRQAYTKYLAYEVRLCAGRWVLPWEASHCSCGARLGRARSPGLACRCLLWPILSLACGRFSILLILLFPPPVLPQGCWQLCLDELLGGNNPTAATFLTSGCSSLKKALGLEQLFLTQYSADPSLYTQDGMQCVWCVWRVGWCEQISLTWR